MKFNENSFSERVQHRHDTKLEVEHEVQEYSTKHAMLKEKETEKETEQKEPSTETANERQQEVNENPEEILRKSTRVRNQPERHVKRIKDDVMNGILYANSANTT